MRKSNLCDITAFHRTKMAGHFMSAMSGQKFCTNTRRKIFQTPHIQCKSRSTMARWFLTTRTVRSSTSRICQRPSRRRLKVASKRPSLGRTSGSKPTAFKCACRATPKARDAYHYQLSPPSAWDSRHFCFFLRYWQLLWLMLEKLGDCDNPIFCHNPYWFFLNQAGNRVW